MKIEIKNVYKSFKNNVILEDVNLTFESGNIYGIIGRNGSGKSVLMKMICALYIPTEGKIIFDGENIIEKKTFPKNTRAVIDKPSFINDLTGYENLKLLADIQKKVGKTEIENTMKELNIFEEKDKKYYKYSQGTKQKLALVQVFMENPDVLILDEPFNGIEEKIVKEVKKKLLQLKEEGKLIIFSSHIKEDIDDLTDIIYKVDDKRVIRVNN
ncbi:MAG: ATP-binding cassette domain-containing protein [Bacilli bacterium]|nr:ATP-binding cassette domain-containing protein [Bacilli bacterium]MDD4733437.1 ATP-binding cassette domain-containing protein [Bacilli bacterium]